MKNTEGSEAQKSTLLSYSHLYEGLNIKPRLPLSQCLYVSTFWHHTALFADLNITKTERDETAQLGQTLTMIMTEADCQLEWSGPLCNIIMQLTVRKEVTKVQSHPSSYHRKKK